MGRNGFWVKHLELAEANAFVEQLHRHHKPDRGHRFSIGAMHGDRLVAVAIVGRPKARALDQKMSLEVTRLCSDGTRNACSWLLTACVRAGKALGYERIYTYTFESESGSSLRGAGWAGGEIVRKDGRGWSNRPGREENHPEPKRRWHLDL